MKMTVVILTHGALRDDITSLAYDCLTKPVPAMGMALPLLSTAQTFDVAVSRDSLSSNRASHFFSLHFLKVVLVERLWIRLTNTWTRDDKLFYYGPMAWQQKLFSGKPSSVHIYDITNKSAPSLKFIYESWKFARNRGRLKFEHFTKGRWNGDICIKSSLFRFIQTSYDIFYTNI